jgi:RNA polymerase sigma-70 factor (ECF subfamily)
MKNHNSAGAEFAELLDKFSWSIRASILKFRLEKRGIDPEDIVQEVKIKIWKRFEREKNCRLCPLYIQRIINSTLIDQLRQLRRQESLLLHEKQRLLLEEGENLDQSLQRDIFWQLVGEAADSLMESRRKVVKLFLMDLSIDEISSSLKWSKDKTRNLLYRGLSDLREKLRERGVEYENRH